MPAYYNQEQITAIAKAILDKYSAEYLRAQCQNYFFRETYETAWKHRQQLSATMKDALASKNLESIFNAADSIIYWGFSQHIPQQLNTVEFKNSLNSMLLSFQGSSAGIESEREANLIQFIQNNKGIGISRASKLVCFVNQDCYGIFDSRVSIALRHVVIHANNKNYRAFPILPSQGGEFRHDYFVTSQNQTGRTRTVRTYLDYLKVLQLVASHMGDLTPAQVEMALFMIGNIDNDGAPLQPLLRGMWND